MKEQRLSKLLLELPWLMQNRNVSLDEFCQQFDLTEDEAIKDLSLLTYVGPGKFGGELVDIQYDETSISVIDSQGFDRPLKLNNIEVSLLLLGIKNLRESLGDNTDIRSVEHKLNQVVKYDGQQVVKDNNYLLTNACIQKAMSDKKKIYIEYIDSKLQATNKRSISPLGIITLNLKEYLKAIDHTDNKIKTFRIDRIISCELSIESLNTESVQNNSQNTEKVTIRTRPWFVGNITDLNLKYEVIGDELYLEINVFDYGFLLDVLLRLDPDFLIECSQIVKAQLLNALKKRIDIVK
jgi:proteasome accessory factor C